MDKHALHAFRNFSNPWVVSYLCLRQKARVVVVHYCEDIEPTLMIGDLYAGAFESRFPVRPEVLLIIDFLLLVSTNPDDAYNEYQ